jgi:hypothetical protein
LGVPYRAVRHLSKSSGDSSGPFWPVLQQAHFDMKGGEPKFAALCIEVCFAD